jgi:cell wall-associated NlpC family hydrolase
MKNLLFVSVLLTILSATSLPAHAQKNNHSSTKKNEEAVARPVKFIEGIEIKRAIVPSSAIDIPAVKSKISVAEISTAAIEKSNAIQFKYAQLLNRNVEAVKNISLFNFIEDWWQTKYSYGGSTKSGIDCSGFACRLFLDVYATELPRTARDEYNVCEKTTRDNLAEGDLVFFNTRGGVSHVGVYLGEGYFVHASTMNGVTINNLDDDYYSARFLGGGKILHSSANGLLGTR